MIPFTLQYAVFLLLKDRLLAAERCPFVSRKVAYQKTGDIIQTFVFYLLLSPHIFLYLLFTYLVVRKIMQNISVLV